MTYPPHAAPPVRPARPGTVTVAFYLQLAIVLLLLVGIGIAVAQAVHFDGLIDRAARLTDADPAEVSSERTGNVIGTLVVGVPSLLLAVWLAACAVPLHRGSNAARILTVVAGGLQLLACVGPFGCGLLLIPMMFAAPPEWEGAGEPPPEWETDPYFADSEFYDTLYADSAQDWFFAGLGLVGLVVFALSLAVVVLVLVPPANRYFVPRHDAPASPWPLASYPPVYPYPTYPYPTYPYPAYAYPVHPAYPYPQPYPGRPAPPEQPASAPDQPASSPDQPSPPPADPTAPPL